MGCSQSRQPVAPVATRTSSRGPEPVESAGPGLIKKPSRGVLLQRVPSKQLFSESKQHPITQSVGRSQKRGSVTKAHGMSFTEIKLPADQVISIKAQQQLETTSEEDGAANEDEGDGVSDEDRAVQERVYKAVLEGIGSVVALMQAEPDNSVLQWWCCDGIASLCAGNPENRAKADELEAPALVVRAMRTWPDDNNVALKSCWAIANLSGDVSEKLGNLGAVEEVLRALRSTQDYALKSVAVRTLSSLCEAGANARRARSCGAEEVVKQVMEDHAQDGELMYRCAKLVKALQPVTDNTSMYLTRVVSKRIFAAGASRKGISENVSTLQRRGSASRSHGMSFTEMKLPADQVISLHTQKTVMETASKEELLADEQEREKTVADQVYEAIPGGVSKVMELMRSDPSHAELQWWCADALASLTVGNPDNQALVAKEGGIQLILQAMEHFPDNETVATKCMWAITNLAATQAQLLGELGAVHSVIVSARLMPVHELQSVFVRALANLIADPANLHTALDNGAVEVVEEVAEANEEYGQLLYRTNMLLDALKAEVDEEEPVMTVVSQADVEGAGAGAGAGAGMSESKRQPLTRFESKRLFDDSALPSPKSTSVGRRQRRGSVSKAHGMSFTEIKLPADQVLSLHAEKALKEHAPEAIHEAADPHTTPRAESSEQVIYKAAHEGIVAVITAMQGAPEDASMQWHGCDAIASLTAGKPDNRAAAKDNGGLEVVVTAMKAFRENVTVQLKGAWAVANLAADFAAELGALGAVECIVAMMAKEDYQLRSVGVRALYNLCTTVENTNQARSLHAASVVEDILESHAEDGQLVFRTNNLLAVLREGEDEDDANAQPIA